jgi:hypothetical protein
MHRFFARAVALAVLLTPPAAFAQTPSFVGWPAAWTNAWSSGQAQTTNAQFPNGLAVSNLSGPATAVLVSGTNGFSVSQNLGQNGGGNYVFLIFTPGTNSTVTEAVTNTVSITLSNAPNSTSATTNFNIVVLPPVANNPVFLGFTNTWPAAAGSNSLVLGPRFVSTNPASSPVVYPVPDITNATAVYALFLSNSLGETAANNSVTMPNTNTTYLGTSTGFGLMPGTWTGTSPNYTNVSGLTLIPANPWSGASNPIVQASVYLTNNSMWVGLPVTPGTNSGFVTNYIQLLAYNGNNATTANWTTNNLSIVVAPPLPTPPALQVRFYNSSTNAASNVFIFPTSTDALGAFGNGFWWTNTSGSNNLTNFVATNGGYATVRLSDIGVSGTNTQGQPYYAIYTTNFPNAAWYLSYGGGPLTNGTTSPTPQTNGTWYGSEWESFEVTLAGNPADKCDLTYINQFSIPMTVRALTNDLTSSLANSYPSNSLAFYQICGFTNWTSTNGVAAILTNVASQLAVNFPNAAITNPAGKVVMYAGPSAAGMGSLKGPFGTVAYPLFSTYFAAVQANIARTNKIKDSIGLAGATNAGLGNNPVFLFYYDFDLVVTASNTLLLTNGTINVGNQPGSTGTNLSPTNYTGLWMEIGADAGPSDSWASSAVYLAPTPANYVTGPATNQSMQLYSGSASNGLAGTPVFRSSTNLWLQIATNTGTVRGTNPSVLPNPTATQLYTSQFGTAVMGRILGDMAAGFALGFINSSVINPSYVTNSTNAAYGDSPSGSWWGGNVYPQANTNNSLVYSGVNTNLSTWGNTVYSATKVVYAHPIYDRMQYYGGGNPTNSLQIQPASATNNQVSGPGGSVLLPIWVVEVEFFNGLSSVGGTPPASVLTYSNWLTNYPSLTGTNTNTAADPDGDAFNNAVEYAFDGNPTVGSPSMLVSTGSGSNAVFNFIGLQGASTNYTVQGTTNLSTGPWTNSGVTVSNAANQGGLILSNFYERKEFVVPFSASNSFYRVTFTNQ